jgi:hypothetical protein
MMPRVDTNSFDNFDEFDQLEIPEWDDDIPSSIRKRQEHDLLSHLADRVMRYELELKNLQKDIGYAESTVKSFDVRLVDFNRRTQRLERTVNTGTNCLTSRVSILEEADKGFLHLREEDRKQLEDIKLFATFIKNFPFGFKGAIFAIVISVILVATATDITIRTHGIQVIKQFLQD